MLLLNCTSRNDNVVGCTSRIIHARLHLKDCSQTSDKHTVWTLTTGLVVANAFTIGLELLTNFYITRA